MFLKNIVVVVPAYNCGTQITRVIDQYISVGKDVFSYLLIIDNQSKDDTVARAESHLKNHPDLRAKIVVNESNYGLGGTHKVAFEYVLKHEHEGLVILHGDDQGTLSDIVPFLDSNDSQVCEVILGARFMSESKLIGYSGLRVFGNCIFNALYTVVTGRRIFDMGSGLNFFSKIALKNSQFSSMPNDLTFNNAYLLHLVLRKVSFKFVPISWREVDQISNAKLWNQSIKLIQLMFAFLCSRCFSRTKLLDGSVSERRFSVIYDSTRGIS